MARLSPKTDVLRALFARSGNQCAFPECSESLINKKNKFIGQICHIEAALGGGERYNHESTDEYRRSYENLLIFCYPHHIETNDVNEYPVVRLKQIKNDHEQLFKKVDFKVDEAELMKLANEMDKYWNDIERLNKIDHIYIDSGLAMQVDGKISFIDVFSSVHEAVDEIEGLLTSFHSSDKELNNDFYKLLEKKGIDTDIFDDIPYYENPFIDRNWDCHNLGTPNWLQRLRIDIVHIEVKYLEEYLKTIGNDQVALNRFEKAKESLKEYAQNAMHAD